jgi:hypothetical protein
MISEAAAKDKGLKRPFDWMSMIICYVEIPPRPRIEPPTSRLQFRCCPYKVKLTVNKNLKTTLFTSFKSYEEINILKQPNIYLFLLRCETADGPGVGGHGGSRKVHR